MFPVTIHQKASHIMYGALLSFTGLTSCKFDPGLTSACNHCMNTITINFTKPINEPFVVLLKTSDKTEKRLTCPIEEDYQGYVCLNNAHGTGSPKDYTEGIHIVNLLSENLDIHITTDSKKTYTQTSSKLNYLPNLQEICSNKANCKNATIQMDIN